MAFTYEPLSEEGSVIRLLTIKPSDKDDARIELQLTHTSLDPRPEYIALSYTWGRPAPHLEDEWDDPQSKKSVLVNGKSFAIKYNLYSALLALRRRWSSVVTISWWVDAICINQDDILERNKQVACMQDIYATAGATYVWLGPSDDTAAAAFSKIVSLSNLWNTRPQHLRIPSNWQDHREAMHSTFRSEITSDTLTESWYALQTLASRSWFTRAWVVQETSLSPKTYVQCGDEALTWEHLMNAHHVLAQYAWCMTSVKDICTIAIRDAIGWAVIATFAWAELNSTQIHSRKSSISVIKGTNIMRALDSIRHLDTTDLRDKVYAARGLAGDDRDLISVDYNLSVTSVYVDIAKRSIISSQSFYCLVHCHYPPQIVGLPTWVPDWSDTRRNFKGYEPLHHTGHIGHQGSQYQEALYRVSMGSAPYTCFEGNGLKLIVKGSFLDCITFAASYKPPNYEDLDPTSQATASAENKNSSKQEGIYDTKDVEWLCGWATSPAVKEGHRFSMIGRRDLSPDQIIESAILSELTYTPSNESLREAYFRTLLADSIWDMNQGRNLRLRDTERDDPQSLQDRVQKAAHSHAIANGRRLAMSVSGYLCLVPEAARVGDSIAVVQGAELAFILREEHSKDGFNFIGMAYVHGIMDGEVWDTMKDQLEEISIV
ncbi:MAG: hypothetical protein Q9220_004881 [cf. Caloplaca sp. 1 TL-2023]